MFRLVVLREAVEDQPHANSVVVEEKRVDGEESPVGG